MHFFLVFVYKKRHESPVGARGKTADQYDMSVLSSLLQTHSYYYLFKMLLPNNVVNCIYIFLCLSSCAKLCEYLNI